MAAKGPLRSEGDCVPHIPLPHASRGRRTVGTPLATWRKSGGVTDDGSVSWSLGSYSIAVDMKAGIITSITHRHTNLEANITNHKLSFNHDVRDNWSDASVSFVRPPPPSRQPG